MFNFQKEVVINSVDQFATREGAVGEALSVHDGGRYFKKYVVGDIFKTEAREGQNAKVKITPASLEVEGKNIQILVELGLDRDYRGDYGSALWYFRKPILVDVATEGLTAETLAQAFETAIPAEYKFVTVTVEGDAVVLEGEDCYIKVRNVVVTDFVCDDRCAGNGSEEPKVVGETRKGEVAGVEITANIVEFGTYNYMIQNLRLPTYENLRFKSPASVEMPIMGGKYTQYSFAYCVPRTGLGGVSAASQTIHSTTMHTFFVLAGEVADAFEAELEKIGSVTTIDASTEQHGEHGIEILPDRHVTIADVENKD